MRIQDKIHEVMSSLPAAEKKAAHALLASFPSIGLATVAEFAQAAGTSAPTILRFTTRLGFESYPGFQRALRQEIQSSLLSPLEKGFSQVRPDREGSRLGRVFAQAEENLRQTLQSIPESEFQAACRLLKDSKSSCYFLGGRFTDSIAAYMASHLRIVRPGVRRFQGQVSTWKDQLLDIKAGDVVVIFDIRRYQPDLLEAAEVVVARKARVVLVTDSWLSPVSRVARVVLPCAIDAQRTWDSNITLLALAEALLDEVTQANWDQSKERIQALEGLQWGP
ncbi:MurR/RpiR family transcriptional regulator [Rhodovibrionaceae bacterium A322]